LLMAREIAMKNGLYYVYTGNVHHQEGDTTFCHKCHQPLIVRDWYEIKAFYLKNGSCPNCGTPCAGVFEEAPGHWGNKRQAVYFSSSETQ
ncbi:MAG: AmmeMemoRadiSam system radical SAM enzyme, partial [Bdellovibrio sp.]